jgi:hypothetical protein
MNPRSIISSSTSTIIKEKLNRGDSSVG